MKTPLFTALCKYANTHPTSFYMPGHKHGRGLPQEFLTRIAELDVTEIPGTDNLHFPETIIKESQALTAEAFGAQHSFFLINGSSCGIHASILSLCKQGDKMIIARNCHKSVVAGLTLANAKPVFILPRYNEEFGIAASVDPEDIRLALEENPDAKGVIITSPNFYGVCSDIKTIAEICHKAGVPLIVDEAHGPHLTFCEDLPPSAMASGADIAIQSAHKTLLAFTQASLLHCNSSLVDVKRLKDTLVLIQSTSPSYILMSSLDIARAVAQERGAQLLQTLLEEIKRLKNRLEALPKYTILDENKGLYAFDQTRIVLRTRRLGLSGFQMDRILREEFNIQPELCDFFSVVFITTMDNNRDDFDALFNALQKIHEKYSELEEIPLLSTGLNSIPEAACTPAEAFYSPSEEIALSEAGGRVSSALVVPYPPGIPVLCPGEIITSDTIEYLTQILESGGKVNNVSETGTIQVLI